MVKIAAYIQNQHHKKCEEKAAKFFLLFYIKTLTVLHKFSLKIPVTSHSRSVD